MMLADSNGISIWKILITILVLPMKLIFGIFPSIPLPFFSNPDTTAAHDMGRRLSVVNSFLPMNEALTLAALILGAVLPVAAGYTIGNWIWRHIPTIFGVGTGAG